MISEVGLYHLYVDKDDKRYLDVLVGGFDFDHIIIRVKQECSELSEWLTDDSFDVHIVRIPNIKTLGRGIVFNFQNMDNDYTLVSEGLTSTGYSRRTYMPDKINQSPFL